MSGSDSPIPIRRFSATTGTSPTTTASSTASQLKREESLINAYEAEEERIINVLSRKLEQLREEKIQLENALEAENESHVNRLNRELCALRRAQAQQVGGNAGASEQTLTHVSGSGCHDPTAPSVEVMLEAMRRENEQLRNRLVDTERDYVRIARLNDIYREELLELRRRLGLSVDNLVGLTPIDPFSQPTHRRSSSSGVASSSPSTSVGYPSARLSTVTHAMPIPSHAHGVPIPRPSSSIRRPAHGTSETTTPLSHSPSSAESPSPFVFSPVLSAHAAPAGVGGSGGSSMGAGGLSTSNGTHMTTPPSSSVQSGTGVVPGAGTAPFGGMMMGGLTYPSVPPPSLSSSYGSPVVSYFPQREGSPGPLSRRGSGVRAGSGSGSGAGTGWRNNESRRGSVEHGGRIAETGTLARSRSRTGVGMGGGRPVQGAGATNGGGDNVKEGEQ